MSDTEESNRNDISLEKLAETSPSAITRFDKNGDIVYANSRAEKLLALEKSETANRLNDNVEWQISDSAGENYPREKLPFEIVKNTEEPIHDVKRGVKLPDGEKKFLSINANPLFDNNEKFNGMISVIEDITEHKKTKEEIESQEYLLRRSFIELAETTSRVLGVRDPYTQKHEQRVALFARNVGRKLGLDEDRTLGLYLGGILHDIGKIAIPETILTKPGELKEIEWSMIKSHPRVGCNQILQKTNFPWPIAEITLHHHERLDGSGYPDGLEGDDLSLEVRIIGACDVVEAMSSRRPYREARTRSRTIEVIGNGKGDKFDPEVAEILVEMIENGNVEFGGK